MATYAFAMPILPGKTEDLKRYAREAMGPRRDEYQKSSQKMGLEIEQVWIQHTPQGDIVVVRWETDDPTRIFEQGMKSNDPYDVWFREKVIFECLGVDPDGPLPQINEQIVDHYARPASKKSYEESRKR